MFQKPIIPKSLQVHYLKSFLFPML